MSIGRESGETEGFDTKSINIHGQSISPDAPLALAAAKPGSILNLDKARPGQALRMPNPFQAPFPSSLSLTLQCASRRPCGPTTRGTALRT